MGEREYLLQPVVSCVGPIGLNPATPDAWKSVSISSSQSYLFISVVPYHGVNLDLIFEKAAPAQKPELDEE